jgi:hypothetical protein
MNPNDKNQDTDHKDRKNPSNSPDRDRSSADDQGQGLRRKPAADDAAIPELDEPDVEGVGNEGSEHTEATMPPGQGTDPKRNTM